MEVLQDAFRKIRLVTGLTYEHEIIDRFEHQHAYLKEMDDKTAFLRSQVAKIKKQQEHMKVCSPVCVDAYVFFFVTNIIAGMIRPMPLFLHLM